MKINMIGVAVALWIVFVFPGYGHAGTPMETIRVQVNKVLDVLRDPALKAESAKKTKEQKIWEIVDSIFDHTELSKRTLTRNWGKFSADQQKEFERLFGRLLGKVYMDRILAYSGEDIVFTKEIMVSEKSAEIQSKVVGKTNEIPINYRMILKNGQWKVYDVVIEGISLVKNYREQFNEILMKKSPSDLLDTLRKKVDQKRH